MTLTAAHTDPGSRARRVGYCVAVLANVALLYAANAWPGWQALPFLTEDMSLVLWLVNASLIIGIAANAVYLVADPPWVKALGEVLTTGVGLMALIRMWQVFPFDFGESQVDWPLVAHVVLAVAMAGSVIGIVAALVALARRGTATFDPVAGSSHPLPVRAQRGRG